MFKFKNSKKQGDAGLAVAISYFATHGYTVLVPLTDSQDYDLVVDDGSLSRVQVKTSNQQQKNGNFIVGLRVLGGNQSWSGVIKHFDNTQVEILFVLTSEFKMYLIPSKDIRAKSSITLNKSYDKYLVNIN